MGDEDAVPTQPDIMPDLDEVIQFGAAADACGGELPAVHGGVGAELAIVADFDGADLRDLHVAAPGVVADETITETVGADDHARMQDDAAAQARNARAR